MDVDGEPAQLTYLEFELLRTLAAHPGRVFSRRVLLEMLWGGAEYRDPRTIDVHVRHLREKIERDPSEPEFIFTVRGAGYRFRDADVNGAPGLTRLSVKFGLVLFLTVACALAIVGLAVLPQLESRLVNAKIRELERAAPTVTQLVASVENPFGLQDVVSVLASNANARVVVFDALTETALRPVADSSGLSPEDVINDPVALRAASSGVTEKGRVRRNERSYAEVATTLPDGDVVLLAAPLADALSTVKLVRRSLMIAGGIALAVSWLVGYLAALFLTRRITRLERAAERAMWRAHRPTGRPA